MREAVSGRAFPEAADDLARTYGFGLPGGTYRAFVFKLDHRGLGREALEIIHGKARELIAPLMALPKVELACAHDEDRLTGVVCALPDAQADVRRALRQVLNQLEAQKGLLGPVSFSLSLSEAASSPPGFPRWCVRPAS